MGEMRVMTHARMRQETEVVILKRSPQFVGLLCMLAVLAPLALAQETHVSHEGGAWSQVMTGSLAGVKNLRVKVDVGSVVVQGRTRPGISYVVPHALIRLPRKMRGASSNPTR